MKKTTTVTLALLGSTILVGCGDNPSEMRATTLEECVKSGKFISEDVTNTAVQPSVVRRTDTCVVTPEPPPAVAVAPSTTTPAPATEQHHSSGGNPMLMYMMGYWIGQGQGSPGGMYYPARSSEAYYSSTRARGFVNPRGDFVTTRSGGFKATPNSILNRVTPAPSAARASAPRSFGTSVFRPASRTTSIARGGFGSRGISMGS